MLFLLASMECKPRKSMLFYSISIFIFLFITLSALLLLLSNMSHEKSPYLDIKHSSSANFGFWVQDIKMILEKAKGEKVGKRFQICKKDEVWRKRMIATMRRMLSGPGSSPPRCTAKCGRCSPCKPVHVPVPPGQTPVTNEYYPEAWRCKCGNKLYMP